MDYPYGHEENQDLGPDEVEQGEVEEVLDDSMPATHPFIRSPDEPAEASAPFIIPADRWGTDSSTPSFIIPPVPSVPDTGSSPPTPPPLPQDQLMGREWGGAAVSPDPNAWEPVATTDTPVARAPVAAPLAEPVPQDLPAEAPAPGPYKAVAPKTDPPLPSVPPSELFETWVFGRPGGRFRRSSRPRRHRRGRDASAPARPGRRRRAREFIALGLVALLTSGVLGYHFLGSKAAGDEALALSLRPGQTYRYHVHTFFDGKTYAPGTAVAEHQSSTEDVSWRVLGVSGGIAEVSVNVTHRVAMRGGTQEKLSGPIHLVIRVAPDGRIITGGGITLASGPDSFPFPGSDQFPPLLPHGRVSPGDSWSKDFDQQLPFGLGKTTYATQNRFVRFDTLSGVRAAVIDTTARIPFDVSIDLLNLAKHTGLPLLLKGIPKGSHPTISYQGTAQMHQMAWFDPDRGEVLRAVGGGQLGMVVRIKHYPTSSASLPNHGMIRFTGRVGLSVVRESSPGTASSTAPATNAASGSASGTPAPAPATGPVAAAEDDSAQSDLRNALVAAKTYFLDGTTYVGFTLDKAAGVEPALRWNTSPTAVQDQVSIRQATATVILVVTRSESGRVFCMGEELGSETAYGTGDARSLGDCRGGW